MDRPVRPRPAPSQTLPVAVVVNGRVTCPNCKTMFTAQPNVSVQVCYCGTAVRLDPGVGSSTFQR